MPRWLQQSLPLLSPPLPSLFPPHSQLLSLLLPLSPSPCSVTDAELALPHSRCYLNLLPFVHLVKGFWFISSLCFLHYWLVLFCLLFHLSSLFCTTFRSFKDVSITDVQTCPVCKWEGHLGFQGCFLSALSCKVLLKVWHCIEKTTGDSGKYYLCLAMSMSLLLLG